MERWRYEPNYHEGKSLDRGQCHIKCSELTEFVIRIPFLGTGFVPIICVIISVISTPCYVFMQLWPAIWMLPENNTYGDWPLSGEF